MKTVDRLNALSLELKNVDPKTALAHCRKAATLADAISYTAGKAYALNNISSCHLWLANYRESLSNAFAAIKLFESIPDNSAVLPVYNLVGNVYLRLSFYIKALEYYHKTLQLAKLSNNLKMQASALHNIGNVYYAIDDNKNAMRYYTDGYALFRRIKMVKYQGIALMNIGLVHLRYGNPAQSMSCLRRALRINTAVSDRHGQCNCWLHLGYGRPAERRDALLDKRRPVGDGAWG